MNEDTIRRAQYENMVTVVVSAALVLGLYLAGAQAFSLCGFILLLNINQFKSGK